MTDDELTATEETVRQFVERLAGTPYFKAAYIPWFFLQELAHKYLQHGPRELRVSLVAASAQLTWPHAMTQAEKQAAAMDLLCDGGAMRVVGEEFESESIARYLAAGHVVARNQHGRRLARFRMRKYLKERTDWEPTEEFTRFLVILWWRTAAQKEVVKHLAKFLEPRARNPNIFFVADLCRRGCLSESDLPGRTVAALRAEVRTAERSEEDWQTMLAWLDELDPAATVAELEDAVRKPAPDMTVERAYVATTELAAREPIRAAAALTYLADQLWGTPADQVAVAVRIAGDDPDLGARTLERLARDPAIGESRVDAALHVDSPQLWYDVMLDDRLSDDGRLRLLTWLLARHPEKVTTAVHDFLRVTQEEATRIRVAEVAHDHDGALAWQIAADVAFTTDRAVDSEVRLTAAHVLGTFDPSQAWVVLGRLSVMPVVTGAVRVRAALTIAEQGGELHALTALPYVSDLDLAHRAEAAQHLAARNAMQGADAYVAVARACATVEKAMGYLRLAHHHAPGPTAEVLAAVAKDEQNSDDIRKECVDLAAPNLTTARRIEVYSALAQTATDDDTAGQAAARVKSIDLARGERVWETVAKRKMSGERKVHAAMEAGQYGKHVLLQLTNRRWDARIRLKAAVTLGPFDPVSSERVLWELVQDHKIGEVRILAAQQFSGPAVLPALLYIVDDIRGRGDLRYAAAETAMADDPVQARMCLVDRLSYLTPVGLRERIAWLMER